VSQGFVPETSPGHPIAATNPLPVSLIASGGVVSATNPVPIIAGYAAPATASWSSATAANTALTVNTAGYDTVVVTFVPTGTITAGHVSFQIYDGVNWLPVKAARTESYNTESGYALTGATRAWQVPVGGFPKFQVLLDTAISGAGAVAFTAITSSAPDTSVVTAGLDPAQPLPAGTNTLGAVLQAGSSGTDNSLNKPSLPNLGAAFAASGPYASYVLVGTINANPSRANIDVENNSGAQILVVRDDGTASSGSALSNASAFPLGGGAGTGSQGGSWSSSTFKGRLQIYAPSATAQVAVFQD